MSAAKKNGLEALRRCAETPARFLPLKSDALLRLLIADLVGEKPTRRSLIAMRKELDELEALVGEAAESAASLPHRRKYLEMIVAFLHSYLELHRELIAEVERELD